MARPKKPARELITEAEVNAAMLDLLQTQIELEKQQGALDLARAQATTKYEISIDAAKSRVAVLTAELEIWYLAHATPGGKKSIELAYGTISQRTGNPTLKPLNRSWTWKAIGVKLQALYKLRFFHVREPEPDKDLIRAELNADQLRDVGLKVEQEERIHIELDRTKLGEIA